MKNRIGKRLTAGALFLAVAALPSLQAQAGGEHKMTGSSTEGEKNVTTGQSAGMEKSHKAIQAHAPRQVSGQIVMTKTVEVRGADTQNLVAMLKTNKGDHRLVVDLGPQQKFAEGQIKAGASLSAEGKIVQIRDRQFLVADRVKIGDSEKIMTIDRSAQAGQHKKMKSPEKSAKES